MGGGVGAAMGLLFVYRLREGVEGGGGEMWCRGRGGGSASAQHAAVRYNQMNLLAGAGL